MLGPCSPGAQEWKAEHARGAHRSLGDRTHGAIVEERESRRQSHQSPGDKAVLKGGPPPAEGCKALVHGILEPGFLFLPFFLVDLILKPGNFKHK